MDSSLPACPVCFDGFASSGAKTPVQLNCGHMVCSMCEAVLAGREANHPTGRIMDTTKIIGCPVCREPIVLFNTQKHNKHMIEVLLKIEEMKSNQLKWEEEKRNLMVQLAGYTQTAQTQIQQSNPAPIATPSDTETVYNNQVFNEQTDITNHKSSAFNNCTFNGTVYIHNHENCEVTHTIFHNITQMRNDGACNIYYSILIINLGSADNDQQQ